jgi:hypothetical protein
LCGGDAIRVHEHTATQSLVKWDRLAARVVEMNGKRVFACGRLAFPHEAAQSLLGKGLCGKGFDPELSPQNWRSKTMI